MWKNVLLFQDWTGVTVLNLCNCEIDDDGVLFLGGMGWPNLEILDLSKLLLIREAIMLLELQLSILISNGFLN